MKRIFWFNPENDLALAAGKSNYTPPRAALGLRRAGALLPLLWAGDNDKILVVDSTDCRDTRVVSVAGPDYLSEPWGWSEYASRMMSRTGAIVPYDTTELRLIREKSHRSLAAHLLRALDYSSELLPETVVDEHAALKAVARFAGDAVVKLPWSCSGRGVFYTRSASGAKLRERLGEMLHRQGSLTVEPRYERRQDFAALFYIEGQRCRFRGLSLFVTDSSGRYAGNMVASQSRIRECLEVSVDGVVSRVAAHLPNLLGNYQGWVGVDMLTYSDASGNVLLAPCIEVNLRYTMGVAALLASESGAAGCEEALLRVAMPGEIPADNAMTFSAMRPEKGKPLEWPCVVIQNVRSKV